MAADLKKLMEDAATLADTAAAVLPGANIAGGAARIGSQILSVVEDLHKHAPDEESGKLLEDAHKTLMLSIETKSRDLSRRLRG